MGSDDSEDSPKLPNKPVTFLDIPTEEVAWFIDHTSEGYYIRIEALQGRVVIPLGHEIEIKLGALVDDYFTHLG